MSIAILSTGLIPLPPTRGGAVEEYVYQLVRHLRRIGVDAVAVDASDGGRISEEDVGGVRIVRLPVPNVPAFPNKRVAREYLLGLSFSKVANKLGVSVAHLNNAWTGLMPAVKLRLPIVYTCHNPMWPEEVVDVQQRLVRRVESFVMGKSDVVVALNDTMRRSLAEKAHVDERKMVVVPNGVDVEFFKPGLPGGDVVVKYGLEGKRVVLFVGRVTYVKGVHLLLKAFRTIAREYDAKLVIVGPLSGRFGEAGVSKYAAVMMKYAEKTLPKGSYIFTGDVDKETLRRLYSLSYLCVLPSYHESFGMVLIEAMASGCPVVGSRAGAIPDVVVEGVTGLLFEKGNYIDLAAKIKLLLDDDRLRREISKNARQVAERYYSWEVVASKLKRVYAYLMDST